MNKYENKKCWLLLQFLLSSLPPPCTCLVYARTRARDFKPAQLESQPSKIEKKTRRKKKKQNRQKNGNRSHLDLIFVSFWLRFNSRIIWLHYTQRQRGPTRRMFAWLAIVIYSIFLQHCARTIWWCGGAERVGHSTGTRMCRTSIAKSAPKCRDLSIYISIIVMGMLVCMLCGGWLHHLQ